MSKMHANEFDIDKALVQRLVEKQFPQWKNLPLRHFSSSGTDNALFRLGSDMLVHLPRIDWAVGDIDKEYEWLPKIAPFLPFLTPEPIAKGKSSEAFPWTWGIYRFLEGKSPMVGQIPNPLSLTKELIAFIKALHKIKLPHGPISPRGIPLKGKQDIEVQKALKQLGGMVNVNALTSIWEDILKAPPWSKPPVWVHGDLSPGNLLMQEGKLHAVIDFGNLGIGDPACDLIVAWNLLPLEMRDIFRAGLGVDDATWERGRGWALSCALIALPYYKDTNSALANNARHVIQEILQEAIQPSDFSFELAKPFQETLIHEWLKQPHIREWIHGIGLQNTLNGIQAFFKGKSSATYWIGYDKEMPFAFLITSPEGADAITLDVFICDIHYLGKGLATPMIQKFLKDQFSHMKKILIDPEKTNHRAIHVYEKVGFKITGEFIASWHPVPHYQMELDMNDLSR